MHRVDDLQQFEPTGYVVFEGSLIQNSNESIPIRVFENFVFGMSH